MSNASSGLCARAYPLGWPLGWPLGPKTLQTFTYIYTLAQIRPLHCTISSLALRRSAIIPNHAKLYGLMSNKLIICCILNCVYKVIVWWVSQSTWILSSSISTHHEYSSSIAHMSNHPVQCACQLLVPLSVANCVQKMP